MTFTEALAKCERDGWAKYVLTNETILGKDTFLTESYYLAESDGPVSGAIDKSKGKYLKMIIYQGGNNFKDDVQIPYKIVDPNSEGWEAEIFCGDLSIGDFEVNNIQLNETNGNITIKEQDKLKALLEQATKTEYRLSLQDQDLSKALDIGSYFN